MSPEAVHEAARILWSNWQTGRRMAALPPACRPGTRAEGYRVQEQVMAVSGRGLYGWKIAATSSAGQAHIGVDEPLAGRLLTGQVWAQGVTVPLGANHMRVAEAEFAFRMGRDLRPRGTPYGVTEVLDAVATLHPSIEIPDSRYEDFAHVGAAQLIADNACAHYFVLGASTAYDWHSVNLAEHEVTGVVGTRLTRTGRGANVLGGPAIALAWIANELSGLGITLCAGQVVTTGTCLTPLEIAPDDRVVADFGVLGQVEVSFGN